ncbi:hypothetical protein [Enhygromyxa salina]|uniref:hypothetical protein n=1 Tax=Enhygromyxa salina TaxID=215803 RepID=UPI0011BAD3C6|nr:hypothetical protein [Enhygromyxa salina]
MLRPVLRPVLSENDVDPGAVAREHPSIRASEHPSIRASEHPSGVQRPGVAVAQEATDDNSLATGAGRAQAMPEVCPRNQWMPAGVEGRPLEWSSG